jgi:hypothetical protein
MFPYNLLILPLAGGYFILSNLVALKYKYQRMEMSRVLLNAIIIGIALSTSAFYTRIMLEKIFPRTFRVMSTFVESFPIVRNENNRYLGTLLGALAVSIVLVLIINLVIKYTWKYENVISRALDKHGDELEQMFRDSVVNGQLIQLTLKNEKVYLGLVEKIPEPKKTNYVVLLPFYSGYRDRDTKEMKLTTDYALVSGLFANEEVADWVDAFKVVIKQDEILTAQPHDPDIYLAFARPGENEYSLADASGVNWHSSTSRSAC